MVHSLGRDVLSLSVCNRLQITAFIFQTANLNRTATKVEKTVTMKPSSAVLFVSCDVSIEIGLLSKQRDITA